MQEKIESTTVKRVDTSTSPPNGRGVGVFDKNKANVHLMRNTVGAGSYGFY